MTYSRFMFSNTKLTKSLSSSPQMQIVRPQPRVTLSETKRGCSTFQETMKAAGVTPIKLPAPSPNLNAHAERWVRSVKEEVLSGLILFGEGALRKVLNEYGTPYHQERNHQGKGNALLWPLARQEGLGIQPIHTRERLGGLLKYYHYKAA